MLRKHFAMSGDNKPDYTITYHAPQHVPFFGGYAKNWVYGYPNYGSGMETDENPIKFKVIGDKWADGVGEWKFRLDDSSNRIYNGMILGKKIDNLGNVLSQALSAGFGLADMYQKAVLDENNNIIEEKTVTVDNTNIITSVIFGEGIETINGSILNNPSKGQSTCTEITLPESVTQLTGHLFNDYNSLKTITVPQNVIRIDNLCDIDKGNSLLEEIILKPLTPPDTSNASSQVPLGSYSSNVKDSLKIRVYADVINNYKNDSIWGQYSDLYDTINDTIVYYDNGGRKMYIENQDITSINQGTLPESITNVYLPNSIISIGESAFLGYSELTSIVIPNSVNSIGNNAFNTCLRLTSITIPNSVTSIGYQAFRDCPRLTSVEIPNQVTSFGDGAFSKCSRLTSVVWNPVNCPDFSSVSNNPFFGINNQITSFEFGDSVEHIPSYMCYNMPNLISITIPDSVTSIGKSAFNRCSGFTSITIPNSINSIGRYAFEYCSGLTQVIWNAVNYPDFDYFLTPFYEIRTQITSFEFGNSVVHIPGSLCFEMTNLTSITLPDSINSIGQHAFHKCSGLISITLDSTTPPSLGANAFEQTSSDLQIYVPDESVDTYKTNIIWRSYASKIKPISEKPA